MRPTIVILILFSFVAKPVLAQWDEGVAALLPVQAFQLPDGDAVWTDMRPSPLVASEDELVAVDGASLFAGPMPGTLSLDAWHERLGRRGAIDCFQAQTVCAVRVDGAGRPAFLLPLGVEGTPVRKVNLVPRLRLSRQQVSALRANNVRGLVLGDAYIVSSTSEDTHLFSTHPGTPDCSAPGVRCGVVFEVETDLRALHMLLF